MPEKIKIQKYYKKNSKGTKNMRNPHIPSTLLILYFFHLLKKICDFTWLGYCLDMLITFRGGCSMDDQKIQNRNLLKNKLNLPFP